jgi:hypothetical protein
LVVAVVDERSGDRTVPEVAVVMPKINVLLIGVLGWQYSPELD